MAWNGGVPERKLPTQEGRPALASRPSGQHLSSLFYRPFSPLSSRLDVDIQPTLPGSRRRRRIPLIP